MRPSLARQTRARGSVRGAVRRAVEELEGRVLLSAVVWTGAGDGVNWTDPANWSAHALPAASDDVTIGAGFASVQLASGTQAINSLTSGSPLNLAGGTLAVGTTFQAAANVTISGGTLQGGTVTETPTAQFHAAAGRLSGVTLDGPMSVDEFDDVYISNGLTLGNGAVVTLGNATDNSGGTLYFDGPSQTLGGAGSILFAGISTKSLENLSYSNGTAAGLTIGTNITVHGNNGVVTNEYTASMVNQGMINADVAGGNIEVTESSGWTNAGTLTATAGRLIVDGNLATARLGAISNAGGTVELAGTLDNTGSTLALTATTGSWNLSGTIDGGTITETGGARLVPTGGRLSAVTLACPLTLDESHFLYVDSGLTLSGGATITLGNAADNSYGWLYFDGPSQTLGGTGSISFAGTGTNEVYNRTSAAGGATTTLTIGPNVTVHGQYGYLTDDVSTAALILQGTINADVAGGTVGVSGASWTNTGTMTATAGTLDLAGTFTTADLGAVSNAGGGVVRLSGTLDNSGATLALDATTGSWTFTGVITGGTVTETGGAQLISTTGRFTGVTLAGPLTIDEGHWLAVDNGLTLSGGATITLGKASDNSPGSLYFGSTIGGISGSQTLGGTGRIRFAGTGTNQIYNQTYDSANTKTTLTIGPGVTIDGESGFLVNDNSYTDALINQGTISADVAGGTIHLPSIGSWANAGTMTATAGTLALDGSFTTADLGTVSNAGGAVVLSGGLSNAGSTLALNAATGSWTLAGPIFGGTVTEADGAQLMPVDGAQLSGVTFAGTLEVDESHVLRIDSGLTLGGGGGGGGATTITLGNAADNTAGSLYFEGASQTLGGTGSVVFAGSGSNRIVNATLNRSATTTLTIGPKITVHGQNGTLLNNAIDTDAVLNQGTIAADVAGGTITITGNSPFTNAGTLEATAGTLVINPPLIESAGSNFSESASAHAQLAGSLTASNTSPASFQPQGAVALTGAGTAASPQLLEVMSQDLGNTAAGYTNNFAYGSLSLSAGDYVKLTDRSNNSGASGPEALYADSLMIPAGATLDLGGLHLYAMNSQISGKIVGEPIALAGGGPNPSSSDQPLTFTATVNGGVPDGGTITLEDASSNNAVVATGALSGGSATLTIPANTLSDGPHNLIAVYGGDANFGAAQSSPYAQTVQSAVPVPRLVGSPVINGDDPNGLFTAPGQPANGKQRSMVEDIVYTFNVAVSIADANQAFTLALAGQKTGTLPPTLLAAAVAGSNGTQWAVSLTGQPAGTLGSIANGEYRITVNPQYVLAAADGTTQMAAESARTDRFYRLFGDLQGTESDNSTDALRLKAAQSVYNPALDFDGNGAITSSDVLQFKKDQAVSYNGDGFTTTI